MNRKLIALLLGALLTLSGCGKSPLGQILKKSQGNPEEPTDLTNSLPADEKPSALVPENFPDDLSSLVFAVDGKLYDFIGKTPNETIGVDEGNWILASKYAVGEKIPGGTIVEASFKEDSIPLEMGVILINEDRAEKDLSDCTIRSVRLDLSRFFPPDYGKPSRLVFPGGYEASDSLDRWTQLYGKPAGTENQIINECDYCFDDNKRVSMVTHMNLPATVTLADDSLPAFVEQDRAATTEYATELNEEAYLNVGGYKVKMYSTFAEVSEHLFLTEIGRSDASPELLDELGFSEEQQESIQNRVLLEELRLEPGEEYTFIGRPGGYKLSTVKLRLYNDTDTAIAGRDAKVIGININKQDEIGTQNAIGFLRQYRNSEEYSIPVIGVYGIAMGDPLEDALAKVPDDASEKEYADDGGAYFSVTTETMMFKGLAQPYGYGDYWKGDFNDLTLTVLR